MTKIVDHYANKQFTKEDEEEDITPISNERVEELNPDDMLEKINQNLKETIAMHSRRVGSQNTPGIVPYKKVEN